MLHAVIMTHDKFKTACSIRFQGSLLKDKIFAHRTASEVQNIECDICREKVLSLRAKRDPFGRVGGRCVILNLDGD